MKDTQKTNGIPVDELMEIIGQVQETPMLGKFKFTAKNEWIDGAHNQTSMKDFHGTGQTHSRKQSFVFDADEPPLLLGDDLGANPVEYILVGLAGCLTTSMVYHGAALGLKINSIESTLEGELDLQGFMGLDPEVRNGYQNIEVTFKIDADGPEEVLEQLIQLGQARSPVFDVVSHGVPVKVNLHPDSITRNQNETEKAIA